MHVQVQRRIGFWLQTFAIWLLLSVRLSFGWFVHDFSDCSHASVHEFGIAVHLGKARCRDSQAFAQLLKIPCVSMCGPLQEARCRLPRIWGSPVFLPAKRREAEVLMQ